MNIYRTIFIFRYNNTLIFIFLFFRALCSSIGQAGSGINTKNSTRSKLPQFLAAGLPCDSPEHRAASEYPTYKLDQNTVLDTSISWEQIRCNTQHHTVRIFRENDFHGKTILLLV